MIEPFKISKKDIMKITSNQLAKISIKAYPATAHLNFFI